ncbi:MAG: hypothetical protein ACKVQR_05285 [Aquabacterium sp.]
MKTALTVLAALALAAGAATAQTGQATVPASMKKKVLLDLSTDSLISEKVALATMDAMIPAKVWRLYPPNKWGFVSQVEGGFNDAKTCVVTARVMLTPLTVTKGLILRPAQSATTFDAIPNANRDQCQALALAKLKEATEGVVSSVAK